MKVSPDETRPFQKTRDVPHLAGVVAQACYATFRVCHTFPLQQMKIPRVISEVLCYGLAWYRRHHGKPLCTTRNITQEWW
jgi:hypothetical protein